MRKEITIDSPWLYHAWPANQTRHTESTLPSRCLLASVRCGSTIGPTHYLGAVVRAVDDDGVVSDSKVIELLQQLSDHAVVLDHPVGIKPQTGLSLRFGFQMSEDMHARAVEPDEERLAGLLLAIDEIERPGKKLLVDRLDRKSTRLNSSHLGI